MKKRLININVRDTTKQDQHGEYKTGGKEKQKKKKKTKDNLIQDENKKRK